MALTFFWRCEADTLDGTHDFTAGDSTAAANNSPEFSATAGRIGTNGLLFNGISERYDFNPASIATPGEGAVGGWFQFPSAFAGTDAANLILCRGTAANDHVRVTTQSVASERRLTLSIRNNTGGESRLQMSSGNLTAGNWYFFLARWRSASNYRSIAVYDTTMTLVVPDTVDSSTDFSASVPADFASSNGLRFGDTTGTTGTLYVDNVFIATNFDEPIESNATITSYSNYSTGGATTVTPAQAALTLNGRSPTTNVFQNVRIREVLVNASGQAVGSATDIGLRVWYGGICLGAPDVSLNGLTTDANGTTSWSIATGTLAFNNPIFYVAQNSVSYSTYTAARLVPNYE